jgi:hypothetical protein
VAREARAGGQRRGRPRRGCGRESVTAVRLGGRAPRARHAVAPTADARPARRPGPRATADRSADRPAAGLPGRRPDDPLGVDGHGYPPHHESAPPQAERSAPAEPRSDLRAGETRRPRPFGGSGPRRSPTPPHRSPIAVPPSTARPHGRRCAATPPLRRWMGPRPPRLRATARGSHAARLEWPAARDVCRPRRWGGTCALTGARLRRLLAARLGEGAPLDGSPAHLARALGRAARSTGRSPAVRQCGGGGGGRVRRSAPGHTPEETRRRSGDAQPGRRSATPCRCGAASPAATAG